MSTLSWSPSLYHHETPDHHANGQNVKDNIMMQNIWQLKIMAQLCIRLLHCKTIHILYPGNQILGPKVARYVVNEHWSTALVNEHWSWCKTLHIPNKSDKMDQYLVTLVMVIRLEVPLYARLVPDVSCSCSKI